MKRNYYLFMRRKITGAIVGVLGFVIHASSASAQILIATNEPLPLLIGQTQVRFTNYYQAYARHFSCSDTAYIQRVVIENPGMPQGTKSVQVFTQFVGTAGARGLFTVRDIFACDGYQFLDLEPTDPPP